MRSMQRTDRQLKLEIEKERELDYFCLAHSTGIDKCKYTEASDKNVLIN